MTDCSVVAADQERLARRNDLIELYRFLLRPIAQAILKSLPPSFTLEDLEQSGALGLVEAAAAFESYARIKIRGAMLDTVRSQYSEATNQQIPEDYNTPDLTPSPEALLLQMELLDRIQKAISKLTPGQAEVIEIRYREGKTQQETGKELGISQKAVSIRETRARRRLRKDLAA